MHAHTDSYSRKDIVQLLRDTDESGPFRQLLQLLRSNVGARGTDPSENIEHCVLHRSSVRDFHRFTLGGTVLSNTTGMLLHCCIRAHPIENLILLSVSLDQLPAALVVTGQHATHHDEIRPRPERFRDVTWTGAAAV